MHNLAIWPILATNNVGRVVSASAEFTRRLNRGCLPAIALAQARRAGKAAPTDQCRINLATRERSDLLSFYLTLCSMRFIDNTSPNTPSPYVEY